MLVTCKLMFWSAWLLFTLKVDTDCRLLIPCKELRPVLVMRMLSAWVMPVPPNDIDCKAGRAVKFMVPTADSCGNDSSDSKVSCPSSKPPNCFKLEKDKLAS